jgi:hypothetical protein
MLVQPQSSKNDIVTIQVNNVEAMCRGYVLILELNLSSGAYFRSRSLYGQLKT